MRSKPDWSKAVLLVAFVVASLVADGCRTAKPPLPEAENGTRRTTQTGELIGFRSPHGSDAWYGIPYAKPPVAALRWHAPLPPEPWTGLRPALAHGTSCTQYGNVMGGEGKAGEPTGDEDCLYLSLWSPHFPNGKVPTGSGRLPVMVWIHGGGNTIGYAGFFDGGNLAATEDVVVVAINYRLGPFGWFRHASLRGPNTSELDRSGNFGTLDVVRALEWVRDNISAFGGNPDNVTVFGESAGGANTFTMLLAPQARGLFHRAIVESGGMNFAPVAEAENFSDAQPAGVENSSNEVLLRMLIKDGKATDRQSAKKALEGMSMEDVSVYLGGKTAYDILSFYEPMPGFGMIDMPVLFADGTVLPTDPPVEVLARAGGYNKVPVILGTNRDENKLFMFGDPGNTRWILWMVPRLRDERMYNVTAEYMAKMWKATGADQPAAAMRKNQENVYVYRFDWDEEPTLLGADLSVMLGASHGFEIPFVFGHFDMGERGNRIFTKENEPGRMELSQAMMSYWAEFAYNGAPAMGRKKDLPGWGAAPAYMVLDTKQGGGVRMSSETVNPDAIVADIAADPRLTSAKERCTVRHDLTRWSGALSQEKYAAIEECKAFPFGAYPWS